MQRDISPCYLVQCDQAKIIDFYYGYSVVEPFPSMKKMWVVVDKNKGLTLEDHDISKVKYYQIVKAGKKKVVCKEWSAKRIASLENTIKYKKDVSTGKTRKFRVVGYVSDYTTYFAPGLGFKHGMELVHKKASVGDWSVRSIHPEREIL